MRMVRPRGGPRGTERKYKRRQECTKRVAQLGKIYIASSASTKSKYSASSSIMGGSDLKSVSSGAPSDETGLEHCSTGFSKRAILAGRFSSSSNGERHSLLVPLGAIGGVTHSGSSSAGSPAGADAARKASSWRDASSFASSMRNWWFQNSGDGGCMRSSSADCSLESGTPLCISASEIRRLLSMVPSIRASIAGWCIIGGGCSIEPGIRQAVAAAMEASAMRCIGRGLPCGPAIESAAALFSTF
mmetsp:Transcript_36190/g.82090  ORF Transcript_36190/g.82090 Transcript_36190/m.82090 type:complete len:245 (-) Transcript_36190:251-985(-)